MLWSLENKEKSTASCETFKDWDDPISNEIKMANLGMVIEIKMFQQARTSWTRKINAYLALADSRLSSSAVLTLYGFGDFISEEPHTIVPRILLLEYIPHSMSLNKLENIKLITPWHVHTLLVATWKLNELGVVHLDLEPRNILLCPDHVVILDFGWSTT